MTYQFLDSGEETKLERFGSHTLIRPAPQAIWPRQHPALWKRASATFDRTQSIKWNSSSLPPFWDVGFSSLQLILSATDFGHVGLFPEHAMHWDWMLQKLSSSSSILHLFAHSGAATLILAKQGHRVCHVDASEKAVTWAKKNAKKNHLEHSSIRWIVDDARKFVKREIKRGSRYDAILLDPPSFGRGNKGQVFKIERDLYSLLCDCTMLLSEKPAFLLLTCHTPGLTPLLIEQLLEYNFRKGKVSSGEMVLKNPQNQILPCGTFARWVPR